MITRRTWLSRAALTAGGAVLLSRRDSAAAQQPPDPHAGHPPSSRAATGAPRARPADPPPTEARLAESRRRLGYTPVETPDGRAARSRRGGAYREFHLVAHEVEQEFAPGMVVKVWGYNGGSPGPTLEAVEGEWVRIFVTNRLPEHTTIHWHGMFVPNGMDGVGGLLQPQIKPGETYVYEFPLRQHGTFMYHPHADETVQMALGMQGFFVVHPRGPRTEPIDRDFCLFPHMWAIHPGTRRPDPSVMLDFDTFTFNGRAFPGTTPMVARLGERVRLRFGNVSMTSHPLHIHGHRMWVVETDGGQIPKSGWWPETTIEVGAGQTRVVELDAELPGDWPLHCHKSHHAMNAMSHKLPNTIGADQEAVGRRIRELVAGYHSMGSSGMAEHAEHAEHLPGLDNTLPMMTGRGPYGNIEMGGMFTLLKVRVRLESYADPGWYQQPAGTVAYRAAAPPAWSEEEDGAAS